MIRHSKQHLAATGEGNGEHLGLGALVLEPRARPIAAIVIGLPTGIRERGSFEQRAKQSPRAFPFERLVLLAASAAADPAGARAASNLSLVVGERMASRAHDRRALRRRFGIAEDLPPPRRHAHHARPAEPARRAPAIN